MSETHWKKLTNPDYLGSWDFQKGEERALTIKKVTREEVFNPSSSRKEMCTVSHFEENCKPMILNKTNCKMIEKLYGTPYIESWSKCKIVVGVDKVKAKGELVEALRIRNQKSHNQSVAKYPKQSSPVLEDAPPENCELLFCGDCGEVIEDSGKYTAQQIAKSTLKMLGIQLCMACANKHKLKEREDADNVVNT